VFSFAPAGGAESCRPAHLIAGNPAMAALAAVPIRKMCTEGIDASFPKIHGHYPAIRSGILSAIVTHAR
jgi:hypothetical protein